MRLFFSTLPGNLIECFAGQMLIWHLIAIMLTLGLVVFGLDWQYFLWTRSPILRAWLFPAIALQPCRCCLGKVEARLGCPIDSVCRDDQVATVASGQEHPVTEDHLLQAPFDFCIVSSPLETIALGCERTLGILLMITKKGLCD